MLINRILLLSLIIASGIFASHYGGNVSYALFYMSLLIPAVSLLYTFYVYIRFRIFQEIGQRIVVKGDLIPYFFTLANEDYITFRSVKVNFLHDKSTISSTEDIREYCLLPGQSETMETRLRCNYRGEYFVGASTVDITDFLYLFKITYPINSKLKVTVLPRVVQISRLGIAPAIKDVKDSPYLPDINPDSMDIETRKYHAGDSKKQIHWKVSAKRNQMFCRKFISDPKSETVILMDLRRIRGDSMTTVITEDQIIESALAIANYCKDNNTRARVCYEQAGLKSAPIGGRTDFDLFYRMTIGMYFNSQVPLEFILKDCLNRAGNTGFYILITHEITFELYKTMLEVSENGYDLSLLLMRDKTGTDEEDILKSLRFSGISARQVTREDDIGEVLKA